MIRFEHPNILYLLLILPLLLFFFYMYMLWKRKTLYRLGDYHVVNQLIPDFSPLRYKIKFSIFISAIAFLIFGMANPQIGSKLEEIKRKGVDLVIALDVSNSMMSEDIKPCRLARAKMAISRLIDRLESDRLGIIVFAGKAFTVIANDEVAALLQAFIPFTIMFPEIAEVPKLTIMVLVVLVPVAPLGKVQIYEVA